MNRISEDQMKNTEHPRFGSHTVKYEGNEKGYECKSSLKKFRDTTDRRLIWKKLKSVRREKQSLTINIQTYGPNIFALRVTWKSSRNLLSNLIAIESLI